ncbi:hypothetical protein BUALT_Bualt12G0025700 [Buddleja alternifolia]|uniref:Uncharacterized protein n=1 Tax=Buddleja alternifolia TaxID=168488 RepID=A0AAV6WMW1_9LAMI|nr:hypothetical protein BUALT_Bualt12G0025700 [Buddleja alternifolia]
MAGLQYYFFPTDFYYPRPPSVNGDTSSHDQRQVLPVKNPLNQETDIADALQVKNATDQNTRSYKVVKVPSSMSLVPTLKPVISTRSPVLLEWMAIGSCLAKPATSTVFHQTMLEPPRMQLGRVWQNP